MPLIGYNKKYEPIVAKERTTEMTDLLTILAQAAEDVVNVPSPSLLIMLIPLAVMIVIAYLLVIRPRKKRDAMKAKEMLNSNTDNRKEK